MKTTTAAFTTDIDRSVRRTDTFAGAIDGSTDARLLSLLMAFGGLAIAIYSPEKAVFVDDRE